MTLKPFIQESRVALTVRTSHHYRKYVIYARGELEQYDEREQDELYKSAERFLLRKAWDLTGKVYLTDGDIRGLVKPSITYERLWQRCARLFKKKSKIESKPQRLEFQDRQDLALLLNYTASLLYGDRRL